MREKIIKNGDCIFNGTESIERVVIGHMYGAYEIIGTTKKKRGVVRVTQKFIILRNSKTNRVINASPNQLEKLSKMSFSNADLRKRSFRSKCAFSELQAVEIYQEIEENKTLPLELKKSMQELATKYNVSVTTLHNLITGKTYPIIKLIKNGKLKAEDLLKTKRTDSINEQIRVSITILDAIKNTVIFVLRQLSNEDKLLIAKVKNIKPYNIKTMPSVSRYEILTYNKEQINNAIRILISCVK